MTAASLSDASARNTLNVPWSQCGLRWSASNRRSLTLRPSSLRFVDPAVQGSYRFEPGQFNMLYLPGFGEAAISISSDAEDHNSNRAHRAFRWKRDAGPQPSAARRSGWHQGAIWQHLAHGGSEGPRRIHRLRRHRLAASSTGDLPHPAESGGVRQGDSALWCAHARRTDVHARNTSSGARPESKSKPPSTGLRPTGQAGLAWYRCGSIISGSIPARRPSSPAARRS